MAIWSRLKSLAGGNTPLANLASAATLNLPDIDNAWLLTGSTTITSILCAIPAQRARLVTFIGAASCNVTFTNTNTTTTAGQMYLRGSDLVVLEDYVLRLLIKNDGTITLVDFTG